MKSSISNSIKSAVVFLSSCYFPSALAGSLGELSESLFTPILGLAKVMHMVCYTIGAGCLAGSVIQYSKHRKNPTQIRLTTPVTWLILGLVLVLLPWFASSSKGSPFSL